MEEIFIDKTSETPKVQFENSGRLILEGRSMPKNVLAFYDPLIEWVKVLDAETIIININLEYINTSSSKKLFEILKILDANNKIRQLTINWYYEDEDILEKGQIYEDFLLKTSFRYHEMTES